MPWRIEKEFRFEAAHSLPQLPEGHKCRRTHGHSYRVVLALASQHLDERGFASVDYADLDWFGDILKRQFDHRDLNEVLKAANMDAGENTTAELIALYLFQMARSRWPNVVEVAVSETQKTWVRYTA